MCTNVFVCEGERVCEMGAVTLHDEDGTSEVRRMARSRYTYCFSLSSAVLGVT